MTYEKFINPAIAAVPPSGIRRFFDIAATMKDAISLGVGEPDFVTPYHIRNAAINSLLDGETQYTGNRGMPELLEEISWYLEHRYQTKYDPATEIMVTVGASEAIDVALRALVSPGDEVLVPEPCFVSYAPIATLCGAVPVAIPCLAEDAFRLNAETLRAAITPKTKALIFPFPNNPTGAVMRREHLEQIAAVLRETNVLVLSDEIYAELTYGGIKHVSIASLPGMAERTVVVNGFSKAYAMTGWRLGYCCGPAPIIKQMLKVHQYAIMCAPTTAQYAAIEALRNGDASIQKMVDEYDIRRRLITAELDRIGFPCFNPEGAFYCFPDIRKAGLSSEEFCGQLLRQQHVAVVPGTAFGDCGEGFVRVSYCYSLEHLVEAVRRMERFCG